MSSFGTILLMTAVVSAAPTAFLLLLSRERGSVTANLAVYRIVAIAHIAVLVAGVLGYALVDRAVTPSELTEAAAASSSAPLS